MCEWDINTHVSVPPLGMFHINIMTVLLSLQSCKRLCAVGSQSCSIPWLYCWLYSHGLYEYAVGSVIMQETMTVLKLVLSCKVWLLLDPVMQETMIMLLALWSCKIQWLYCWIYNHAGEYECAVGSTVMQEIKTVLSQAACLHFIRQIQKNTTTRVRMSY